MRIEELSLITFGPFERLDLKFSPAANDITIIYGSNEAGKSTSIAALNNFLFGFGHKTQYGFKYPQSKMKVAGVVEVEGDKKSLIRHKRRQNDLTGFDEAAVDEAMLRAHLMGYSEDTFSQMFSLGSSKLREGGRSMIAGQDDIGREIFSAGAGLVGIGNLLSKLREESDAIWMPTVRATPYKKAAGEYDDAKGRLKHAENRPAKWEEARLNVKSLAEKEAEYKDTHRELTLEQVGIVRMLRVLPAIGRLLEVKRRRSEIIDTPTLPENAAATLKAYRSSITTIDSKAATHTADLTRLTVEMASLSYDDRLIKCAPLIAALKDDPGVVKKAEEDLPARVVKCDLETDRIKALYREVGWSWVGTDEVANVLPTKIQIDAVQALGHQQASLLRAYEEAAQEVTTAEREQFQTSEQLEALPDSLDVAALIAALSRAKQSASLETEIRTALANLADLERQANASMSRLAPWIGNEEALENLVIPDEAQASSSVAAISAAKLNLDNHNGKIKQAVDNLAASELRRKQAAADHLAVPIQTLLGIREERDDAWQQIRLHLTDDSKLDDPEASASQYEIITKKSDDISDQRYAGAEQTGRLNSIDNEIEFIEATHVRLGQETPDLQHAYDQYLTKWREQLAGAGLDIDPSAFITWLGRRRDVLAKFANLKTQRDRLTGQQRLANDLRDEIDLVYHSVTSDEAKSPSLIDAIRRAEVLLAAETTLTAQRAALTAKVETAGSNIATAQTKKTKTHNALDGWNKEWAIALPEVGLDVATPTSVALSKMAVIEEIRTLATSVKADTTRITQMNEAIKSFDREVRALAANCGVSEDGLAARVLYDVIVVRAAEAAATKATMARLTKDMDTAQSGLQEVEVSRGSARSEARSLFDAAGTEDLPALEEITTRAGHINLLEADEKEAAGEVVKAWGGSQTLDFILDACQGADAALLSVRNDELSGLITDQVNKIAGVNAELGAARQAFDAVDDRPDAAIAGSDVEMAKSDMVRLAETYIRRRAEYVMLNYALERFRLEQQNPLLKRATSIFGALTEGRYKNLRVDNHVKSSELFAVTTDGDDVPIDGLSEGTVDQLYLSLRLAAVEQSVAGGARLPFIADDLLVNYDNRRAAAGLRVLSDLSRSTQVLFFTHHEHLVELAQQTLGEQVSVVRY